MPFEQKKKRLPAVITQYDTSQHRYNDAATAYSEAANGRRIAELVYRGPQVIYPLLGTMRELHDKRPQVRRIFRSDPHFSGSQVIVGTDIFDGTYHGVSVLELEQMQPNALNGELRPAHIQRINALFTTPKIFPQLRTSPEHKQVLEYLTLLAAQSVVDPQSRRAIPQNLQNLHRTVSAYLDYYTQMVSNKDLDETGEINLLTLMQQGAPYLHQAISIYLPAKLGISPSSAIKLYQQKEALPADPAIRLSWRLIEKFFIPSMKEAYRDTNFSRQFQKYMTFDQQMDDRAVTQIVSHLKANFSDAVVPRETAKQSQALQERFAKNRSHISQSIRSEELGVSEYSVSGLAERLLVTNNGTTMVFILLFPDNTHLTLELNKEGKLYGIPAKLLKNNPQIQDYLLTQILTPILEPYPEPNTPNTPSSITYTGISSNYVTFSDAGITEENQPVPMDKQERYRRRKALLISQTTPNPPAEKKISREVVYTETMIKKILGTRARNPDLVDQIIASMRRFSTGDLGGQFVPASALPGIEPRSVVTVRSGDYNILLDRLEPGVYRLRDIPHIK